MFRGPTLLLLTLILCACSGGGSSSPPPVTATADSATTPEDQSVTIAVTANDTNVDPASLLILAAPHSGTAQIVAAGQIRYSPNGNFNGSDSFTYQVGASKGSRTATASVSVTITPVNDAPTTSADAGLTVTGHAIEIDLLANDSDVDSPRVSLAIVLAADPAHGNATVSGGNATYTPAAGFAGDDEFTYRVQDDQGALSAETAVSITVLPIDATRVTVRELALPTEDYTASFNAGVHQNVLQSPPQHFTILPHTVSFTMHLIGDGVFSNGAQLVFSELQDPDGNFYTPLFSTVQSCDTTFCSLLLPKRAEYTAIPGEWSYRIATLAMDTHLVPADGTLHLVVRTGPEPVFTDPLVARIRVNTVITGNELSTTDVEQILLFAQDLLQQNGIVADFSPVTYLHSVQFSEVSKDFNHSLTLTLVTRYGVPASANVFILDGFSDAPGTLGITAAVPASLGIASQYNAVLIDGTGTRVTGANPTFFRRTMGQVVVHELGHYLGLNHTTEGDFAKHDLITDTPECLKATHDLNHNGVADQDECPDGTNIMFWQDLFVTQKTLFTADQQYVMDASPIAVTASE